MVRFLLGPPTSACRQLPSCCVSTRLFLFYVRVPGVLLCIQISSYKSTSQIGLGTQIRVFTRSCIIFLKVHFQIQSHSEVLGLGLPFGAEGSSIQPLISSEHKNFQQASLNGGKSLIVSSAQFLCCKYSYHVWLPTMTSMMSLNIDLGQYG